VNREEQLSKLKEVLQSKVDEFVTWWGTSHQELAQEIDTIMDKIQEIEETLKQGKKIKKD
tara:strand:- start:51 stop:230 length:180 start_codon:yes stop_codon:yes gene_type:complete